MKGKGREGHRTNVSRGGGKGEVRRELPCSVKRRVYGRGTGGGGGEGGCSWRSISLTRDSPGLLGGTLACSLMVIDFMKPDAIFPLVLL